jgi:hypothetical protein
VPPRRSLEPSRLLALAAVIFAIGIGLVVLDLALSAVLGASPRFLRKEVVYSPSEFDRIAERISSAERAVADEERTRGIAASALPLTIVVGLSTAREDIDAPTLERAICRGSRLLNLGSSGGSFSELRYYLGSLERTQLHPQAMLLAVHPVWMTSRVLLPERREPWGMTGAWNLRDVRDVPQSFEHSLWSYTNRDAIHTLLTNELLKVRWQITAPFGLTLPSLVPRSSTDPWAPRYAYTQLHASPDFMRAQLATWKALGWFDSSSYMESRTEDTALIEIARLSGRLAEQSIVVLMPETSTLRLKTPLVAERALRAALTQSGYEFPILDFRRSIADSLFYDYAHLNATGRGEFSRQLAAVLEGRIKC